MSEKIDSESEYWLRFFKPTIFFFINLLLFVLQVIPAIIGFLSHVVYQGLKSGWDIYGSLFE
jgi:hypothetical protein